MNEGCFYSARPTCPGCPGDCWLSQDTQPTVEQACADLGHPPAGELDGVVYCHCGQQLGPVGTSTA
jgi:hypothetical protein